MRKHLERHTTQSEIFAKRAKTFKLCTNLKSQSLISTIQFSLKYFVKKSGLATKSDDMILEQSPKSQKSLLVLSEYQVLSFTFYNMI